MTALQTSAGRLLLEAFVTGDPVPEPRPRATILPGKVIAGYVVRRPKATVYTPRKGRAKGWHRTVYLGCLQHRPAQPASGLVVVWLWFRLTRAGFLRADWDNLAKGTLDALRGLAYVDDRQIKTATVDKAIGEPTGVRIRVEALSA